MKQHRAEPFFDPGTEALRFLPEGPRQLRNYPRRGNFLGWVAIQHGPGVETGSINVLDLDTLANENHPLPGRPGFFAETEKPGVVLVGLERRLVTYDLIHREIREIAEVTSDSRCVINEGLAIPGGALFGTKNLTFDAPIAEMYRFDSSNGRVITALGGQICSNGKHLYAQDGEVWLADIDSFSKCVARYHVEADGSFTPAGKIADFASLGVFPDGMRPSGNSLIVAFYDPRPSADGFARRYDIETGEPLEEWLIPGSPRVTCPEFVTIGGEPKLLFTTAVEGMPGEIREIAPRAGQLFVAPAPGLEVPAPPPLVAC